MTPWFQSTLPHGERQRYDKPILFGVEFQSTLPHGERPGIGVRRVSSQRVSIHAPTRGATRASFQRVVSYACFNPRSHTGSDMTTTGHNYAHRRFNPRSHTGSDPRRGHQLVGLLRFQSTLPHGERQGRSCRSWPRRCFNPRSHTGSDAKQVHECRSVRVSIHAPTRGATLVFSRKTTGA